MKRLLWIALAACLLAQPASAILITATDPISQWDLNVGNGSYSTADGTGGATGLTPPSLSPAELLFDMQLVGVEAAFTIGTEFGPTGSSAEFIVFNGVDVLLAFDIVQNLKVTNVSSAGQTITIGNRSDPTQGQIELVGGTLVNSFGGVGTKGSIELFLTNLNGTSVNLPDPIFDVNFTAQTNIEILLPEPGIAGFLTLGLLGIAFAARRRI